MRFIFLFVICGIFFGVSAHSSLGDIRYEVIGLEMSFASGVSDYNGNVNVVGVRIAPPPFDEYYNAVWQTIGQNALEITSGPGILSSHPTAVRGHVAVGNTFYQNGPGELIIRATLYESGVAHTLDSLSNESRAEDINSFGLIVGNADFGDRVTGTPCLWSTGDSSMIQIGNVEQGSALAINNQNQVVGYMDIDGQRHAAFLADLGGTMTTLNVPGSSSQAVDINDQGDILGMFMNEDGNMRTFVTRTDSAELINLIDIPGNGSSIFANAINSEGFVVGQFLSAEVSLGAYIWSSNTGTIDLNGLIDPYSGWQLRSATGISDSGHIVGYGFNPNGEFQGFLLRPIPCPGSSFVFVLCIISGMTRVRQRKK